jgi:hypothetical protein
MHAIRKVGLQPKGFFIVNTSVNGVMPEDDLRFVVSPHYLDGQKPSLDL